MAQIDCLMKVGGEKERKRAYGYVSPQIIQSSANTKLKKKQIALFPSLHSLPE